MAKKDGTDDLRIRRTQKAIKEAFFTLVEEKGFENVSVKDITDMAMISRNTFYLHYKDKFDLLDKICDDLTRKLFFDVGKQLRRVQKLDVDVESAATIIQLGATTINEDRKEYQILLSSSGCDVLTRKQSEVVRRSLDFIKDDIAGISNYSIEYIVSGLSGVMRYFATHDVEDVENDALNFSKLHLGSIIENIKHNREQVSQWKINEREAQRT